MLKNPEGMELFSELCKRLKDLKLVTNAAEPLNESEMEEVSFYYDKEIQDKAIHPSVLLPVATVQFVAEKHQLLQNEVLGVSLKFHQAPLYALDIEPDWETFKQYRTDLQGPQYSQYYTYVFVDPYTREHVYSYIDALFSGLQKEFSVNPNFNDLISLNHPQMNESLASV